MSHFNEDMKMDLSAISTLEARASLSKEHDVGESVAYLPIPAGCDNYIIVLQESLFTSSISPIFLKFYIGASASCSKPRWSPA